MMLCMNPEQWCETCQDKLICACQDEIEESQKLTSKLKHLF